MWVGTVLDMPTVKRPLKRVILCLALGHVLQYLFCSFLVKGQQFYRKQTSSCVNWSAVCLALLAEQFEIYITILILSMFSNVN